MATRKQPRCMDNRNSLMHCERRGGEAGPIGPHTVSGQERGGHEKCDLTIRMAGEMPRKDLCTAEEVW